MNDQASSSLFGMVWREYLMVVKRYARVLSGFEGRPSWGLRVLVSEVITTGEVLTSSGEVG